MQTMSGREVCGPVSTRETPSSLGLTNEGRIDRVMQRLWNVVRGSSNHGITEATKLTKLLHNRFQAFAAYLNRFDSLRAF